MSSLRLMTLNMASGCGMPYVDFTAATHASFINRLNPDVVLLQEVDRRTGRAGGVDQLAVLRDSTQLRDSHFVKWRNLEGGEYGVAIISKHPLLSVENRSVYKPAEWWPWLVVQVVTPVAYAQIDLAGTRVHLYATHFPSNDEGRKKFGADQIAARIPAGPPTVFGGDFNDGPGGTAMSAIDARFVAAESIAGQVVADDQPVGVVVGDGVIDRGLDHCYVSGGMSCDTWRTVFPVEGGRQFSDHPIAYADLRPPAPAPVLRALGATVLPYPVALDVATTLTVSATDAASSASVAGSVIVDGVVVAPTNTPFTMTLRQRRERRFDPEIRRWIVELVDPTVTVRATGYREAPVDLGF